MPDYMNELYKRRRGQQGYPVGEALRAIGAGFKGTEYKPLQQPQSELSELTDIMKYQALQREEEETQRQEEYQTGLRQKYGGGAQTPARPTGIPRSMIPTLRQPQGQAPATPSQAPSQAPPNKIMQVTRQSDGSFKEEVVDNPEYKLWEEGQKSVLKERSKMGEGKRAAERSLSVVSTTLNDFSKVLVGAYDEGGFGDIIKASKTALKQKFAGGLATEELVETGKIPGKKVEIITKMMPLLTQQGDKPGSVRLVSTVFERLSDTIPGANRRADVKGNDVSLQEARGMMEETIKSMLRFAQAIQALEITNESIKTVQGKVGADGKPEKGSELAALGDLIERVSKQFFLEGSPEEEQINGFIAQALAPLDERISRLGTEEETPTGLTVAETEELRAIDEELGRL